MDRKDFVNYAEKNWKPLTIGLVIGIFWQLVLLIICIGGGVWVLQKYIAKKKES